VVTAARLVVIVVIVVVVVVVVGIVVKDPQQGLGRGTKAPPSLPLLLHSLR